MVLTLKACSEGVILGHLQGTQATVLVAMPRPTVNVP